MFPLVVTTHSNNDVSSAHYKWPQTHPTMNKNSTSNIDLTKNHKDDLNLLKCKLNSA